MHKKIIVTLAILGMALSPLAHAALSVVGSVGGSPTGVFKVNFDDLALGSGGGVSTTPNGFVQVAFTGDGAVVQGETVDNARPVLSGGNGLGFGPGGTSQANGEDS